jgi:hypothetical protein
MGAAVSLTSEVANSDKDFFTMEEAKTIITKQVLFKQDLFDQYADRDGLISKQDLLDLIQKEATDAINMCGENYMA